MTWSIWVTGVTVVERGDMVDRDISDMGNRGDRGD